METIKTATHKIIARESGSVRVDLVGGTLDLYPINLILPNVYTFNVATSLKADVVVYKNELKKIVFNSKDYDSSFSFSLKDFSTENLRKNFFKECTFLCHILNYFFDQNLVSKEDGYTFDLSSGSPIGAGLGGSSAMGITFFKCLSKLSNTKFDLSRIVSIVQGLESLILGAGPAGYQDYYPALTGGILGLKAEVCGVKVEQVFNKNIKAQLEENLVLIYSGKSRQSGINNWEVYKGFFDKVPSIVSGLEMINKISNEFADSIASGSFEGLCSLIAKEGAIRENLFPGIMTKEMKKLYKDLKNQGLVDGVKVCGAGGGGCFLLITTKKKELLSYVLPDPMSFLEFKIEAPLS